MAMKTMRHKIGRQLAMPFVVHKGITVGAILLGRDGAAMRCHSVCRPPTGRLCLAQLYNRSLLHFLNLVHDTHTLGDGHRAKHLTLRIPQLI